MDSLRVELKPWHVEVISIQPGVISTPIWDKALNKADEILANLPEQAHRLYGPKLPEVRGQLVDASQRGIPPEAVARTVAKALSARRPRTRYLVGLDARIGALLAAILPDRLRDRLIKTI